LNKTDKAGNALAGSSFAIAGTFAGNTEDSEKVLVDGEASGFLSSQLIIGNTYVIKETAAPKGYAKIKDYSVKVNENGTLTAVGTLPAGVTLDQNTVAVADHKTDVTVKKQDAAGNALIGSTIKITGVFSDSNDQSSVKIVLDGTQDTGTLLGKLIEGNDYTLEETAAPNGYESIHSFMFHVNDDGSLAFKGDHDQNISLENDTLIIKDAETSISFIKYDEEENKLVGSTFALTGKMSDDPEHDATIELLNGTASEETLNKELIIGNSYTLQEKSAPKGYTLLKDPITFSINADGTVELADGTSSAVNLTKEGKGIKIMDTMISVQLRKVSKDTKDLIQDADFKITGKFVNGKTELTGTPEELSEQMKGNLYASDINADKSTWSVYSVAETKRPDGYLIEENPAEFLVDDRSQIHVVSDESKCTSLADGVTLDFADDATKVSILKTDTNGKALKGAQFQMEGTLADGSKVKNIISETEASTFKALFITGNTYTINEVKAPDGYVKMKDTVSFTVGDDGLLKLADGTSSAVTLSGDQKEIKIADEVSKISVLKTDTKGKALAGAQFKIEGTFADGSKVRTLHRKQRQVHSKLCSSLAIHIRSMK
jgi:hypothetical protein